MWANFFAVGIVEAVDDLRMTNPASNEKLLGEAAAHLAKNHFDLKSLMRVILQSETYQRSSVALPENRADKRFYSRYYPYDGGSHARCREPGHCRAHLV